MSASHPLNHPASTPYSPSSPPLGSYKQSASATNHPQTPTSPPLMSLSSQRHVSPSSTAYTSSATATSQLNSSETPPSTVPMSAQSSQQPILTTTNTFPTPSSIVTGTGPAPSSSPIEGEGGEDTPMASGEEKHEVAGPPLEEAGDTMQIDAKEHNRSDHDRHTEPTEVDTLSTLDSAKSRKRSHSITSDQDESRKRSKTEQAVSTQAKMELEPKVETQTGPKTGPDLSRLHADIGRPYLLCQTPHPIARPHPSEDLLSLFDLQPLASTVARIDPVTGEKRKTRKTYKKYLQMFSLAGRNSEVCHPPDQPGGFEDLLAWPEEEWENQKVAGKDVNDGLSEDTLSKLDRALKMEPGPMPDFDASVLGLDAPPPRDLRKQVDPEPAAAPSSRPATQPNGSMYPTNGAVDANSSEPVRPKRTSRKRRYDEKSFEGYGEGFADDDVDAAAIHSDSDREGSRRGSSSKKKRKKNSDTYGNASPPGMPERGGSYGVGMVGIGTGIGAYGGR